MVMFLVLYEIRGLKGVVLNLSNGAYLLKLFLGGLERRVVGLPLEGFAVPPPAPPVLGLGFLDCC